MKKEDSEILSKIGKQTGFKVPDGYFADFAKKMTESLPDREFEQEVKPTLWHHVRPWIYMAAMFGGIWCMMHLFTDTTTLLSQRHSTTSRLSMTSFSQEISTNMTFSNSFAKTAWKSPMKTFSMIL